MDAQYLLRPEEVGCEGARVEGLGVKRWLQPVLVPRIGAIDVANGRRSADVVGITVVAGGAGDAGRAVRVDRLLDDERFFAAFVPFFHATHGRPSIRQLAVDCGRNGVADLYEPLRREGRQAMGEVRLVVQPDVVG